MQMQPREQAWGQCEVPRSGLRGHGKRKKVNNFKGAFERWVRPSCGGSDWRGQKCCTVSCARVHELRIETRSEPLDCDYCKPDCVNFTAQ